MCFRGPANAALDSPGSATEKAWVPAFAEMSGLGAPSAWWEGVRQDASRHGSTAARLPAGLGYTLVMLMIASVAIFAIWRPGSDK